MENQEKNKQTKGLYPNYSEIKNQITSYLKSKGLGLYDHITQDSEFLKLKTINNQRSELALSVMNEILKTLNQTSTDLSADFNTNTELSITCETFINYFVDVFLYDYKKLLKQQEDYIKEYKITKTLSQINRVIPTIKKQVTTKGEEPSILSATLLKLNKFPKDNYVIKLVIIYSDKTKKSFQVSINSDLLEGTNSLNIKFPEISFQEYRTPNTNQNDDFLNISTSIDYLNGCSLNSYYFEIEKNGESFMVTENRYFYLQFLNLSEKIINLQNEQISHEIQSENENQKEMSLSCTFTYKFNNSTRLSILEEITQLYGSIIKEKNLTVTSVISVLECYFTEINLVIQSLLKEERYEDRACCNECILA
jgi:hypothetical protein